MSGPDRLTGGPDRLVSGPDRLRLIVRLRGKGLTPAAWSNAPGDRYDAHAHDYDKVLVASSGSIVFGLADGTPVELRPGDRLDLPAGTRHDAVAGADGVECLECHLPAGSLGPVAIRRPAGEW